MFVGRNRANSVITGDSKITIYTEYVRKKREAGEFPIPHATFLEEVTKVHFPDEYAEYQRCLNGKEDGTVPIQEYKRIVNKIGSTFYTGGLKKKVGLVSVKYLPFKEGLWVTDGDPEKFRDIPRDTPGEEGRKSREPRNVASPSILQKRVIALQRALEAGGAGNPAKIADVIATLDSLIIDILTN